jgi:hypothetical protein
MFLRFNRSSIRHDSLRCHLAVNMNRSGVRCVFLFLAAMILALPLTAGKSEPPPARHISTIVPDKAADVVIAIENRTNSAFHYKAIFPIGGESPSVTAMIQIKQMDGAVISKGVDGYWTPSMLRSAPTKREPKTVTLRPSKVHRGSLKLSALTEGDRDRLRKGSQYRVTVRFDVEVVSPTPLTVTHDTCEFTADYYTLTGEPRP